MLVNAVLFNAFFVTFLICFSMLNALDDLNTIPVAELYLSKLL